VTRSERYTLTVARTRDGQIESLDLAVHDLDGGERRIHLAAQRASWVAAELQDVLRTSGVPGRRWTSERPIDLAPALGAHAELLLRAVKPLRRLDRVHNIADGVAGMSREEANYWHAQTRRRHGLRALRVLLDGGTHR